MFSLCIQYGVVPDSFRSGILVPIPKKTGCDTSEARNWRPIVISSTFSKILELYVLDKCKQHSFSEMQFGFVPKRGTNTATSLLNRVGKKPAFIRIVQAAGFYRLLPAFTGYYRLLLAYN